MPDFSREKIKYNPPTASPGYDVNKGDFTDSLIAGSPRGVFRWRTVADLTEAIKTSIQSWVETMIVNAIADIDPATTNHILGTCRFDHADAPGLYGVGQNSKALSGSAAGSPVMIFPWIPSVVGSQKVKIGVVYAVNGVGFTGPVSAGFYPVDISGSGNLVYSLSTLGSFFDTRSDLAGNFATGTLSNDIREAMAFQGNELYALGVNLGSTPPAGCVVDVGLSMQLSQF